MLHKNEKNLLDFIKYSPILFIFLIAIGINVLIHIQNNIYFEKEIKEIRESFIINQKDLVKNEVEKIYKRIITQRKDVENKLKESIKSKVYEAYSIVNSIYMKNKNKSEEEILTLIKNALRDIRFNKGRGYFFIDHLDGTKILQPINPSIENGNFLEYKDTKGYKFVKTISNTIKNNTERFDEYFWPKPNSKKSYRKISFYKTFKPLNVAIGAGEYVDDFTNELQQYIINTFIKNNRYGKNGYIFLSNYDGKILSHIKSEDIGKNKLNFKDKNNFYVVKEIIKAARDGGGYITYLDNSVGSFKENSKKTTYIKGIYNWQWAIASGFYYDEIEKMISQKEIELKQKNNEFRKTIFFISIPLTFVLILLSIYISSLLSNSFQRYNQRIVKETKENREKENILYQQSKMAAMGEMIANIAHQWRQPLSLITSSSSSMIIQKELNLSTKEEDIKSLEGITKHAEYLSQTIDDFRNFFKPDKEKTIVNIKYIFDKTLLLLRPKFETQEIEIIQNVKKFDILILENEFIQVLINLFKNSEDALFSNKIKRKIIFVDTFKYNDEFVILIKDNANGIAIDKIDRIFEPYFTTKYKSQGTGIGLYMAKQIISKHMNGNISVENVAYTYDEIKYKGAMFTIRLKMNLK